MFKKPDSMILDKLDYQSLQHITLAVQNGYSLAHALIKSSEVLQIPSCRCRHQDIYNYAVDFSVQKKCDAGLIHMEYAYKFNTSRNTKYLQLSNTKMRLTFSSVKSERDIPKKSIFRTRNSSKNPQLYLQGYVLPEQDVSDDFLYGIITHEKISSIHNQETYEPKVSLGIPNYGCDAWLELYSLNDTSVILHKRDSETVPMIPLSVRDDFMEHIQQIEKRVDEK